MDRGEELDRGRIVRKFRQTSDRYDQARKVNVASRRRRNPEDAMYTPNAKKKGTSKDVKPRECHFFKKGTCSKGNDCIYLHGKNDPRFKSQKQTQGGGKKGTNKKGEHKTKSAQSTVNMGKDKGKCFSWMRTGKCRDQANCKYTHHEFDQGNVSCDSALKEVDRLRSSHGQTLKEHAKTLEEKDKELTALKAQLKKLKVEGEGSSGSTSGTASKKKKKKKKKKIYFKIKQKKNPKIFPKKI